MSKLVLRIIGTFLVLMLMGFSLHVIADGLEPPKVQIVDRNHVNMAGHDLSFTQHDLAIGTSDLSLSHTIASYGSDFYGYSENFRGVVYKNQLPRFLYDDGYPVSDSYPYVDVMRVNSGDTTTDFRIVNGLYVGLKNQLSTLVRSGNTYIFTREDGTEITFLCVDNNQHTMGVMKEIKAPNGFTITINRKVNTPGSSLFSVSTNNGLQFKYIYVDNNSTNTAIRNWSQSFPKYIIAINNAVEFCDSIATSCELTNTWPKVTYDWPIGMPNIMNNVNFGELIFKVTDPIGRVTEYYHKPFDINLGAIDTPYYIPRIVKIKDVSGTIEYDYKNKVGWVDDANRVGFPTSAHTVVLEAARLYKATVNGKQWNYYLSDKPNDIGGIQVERTCDGFDCIYVKTILKARVPTKVSTSEYTVVLSEGHENTVQSVFYGEGLFDYFDYDSRKHVNKRTRKSATASTPSMVTEAGYDPVCSNPKTCNRPNWTSDARGKHTDYTYHPESGQIATITKPSAVEGGIRPQTRYTYTQKYAWYKNSSGAYQQASTSIWLKATESYCRTSASTGSGCSASNDEVLTAFDYGPDQGPNNLFLRGVAITADGVTRRTCYSYDNLGNRIGETKPKAGLTSCP